MSSLISTILSNLSESIHEVLRLTGEDLYSDVDGLASSSAYVSDQNNLLEVQVNPEIHFG
uniref:Uncharacterized protein n=1 Tax=Tetranychus urticae TaxID=32264 RepID=T1KW33_TETUR